MTASSRNHPELRLLRYLNTVADESAEEGYNAEAARLCRVQLSAATARLRQWLKQHAVSSNDGGNVGLLLDTLKFNYASLLEPLINNNNTLAESLATRERAPEFFDWLSLVMYDFGEGLPDWNVESAEFLRWNRLEAAMRLVLSRFAVTAPIKHAAKQLMLSTVAKEQKEPSNDRNDDESLAQFFVALAAQTTVWSLPQEEKEQQSRSVLKRKESKEKDQPANKKKRAVLPPNRFGYDEYSYLGSQNK